MNLFKMDYLARNLKYLRKRRSLTQEMMAQELDLKKSTYASYENEDGNTPPARTLYAIACKFEVSMDSLFELDYERLQGQEPVQISDREIYFPVSVDLEGTELIDVVPSGYRAQAGYLSDFSDPAYIQSLPKISWDMGVYESGTKRIFQITGDSMLPIPSQSFVLGVKQEYADLKQDHAYVIVTHHDILFKRIRIEGSQLQLLSDNPLYPPQRIKSDEVRQYWKVLKVIMDMPDRHNMMLNEWGDLITETRDKVDEVLKTLRES